MARLIFIFISLIILLLSACTQNKNGSSAQGMINPSFLLANGKKADPKYVLTLPLDHQSHPEFDIEWWYLTANLVDAEQNPYAFQWTLFRFSNPNQDNAWHNGQTFMAHTSLHSPSQHWFEERFAAGGVGNSMVGFIPLEGDTSANLSDSSYPLSLTMDDWRWQAHRKDGSLFPATLKTSVSTSSGVNKDDADNAVSMTFTMRPSGPFVLQGNRGYSVKSREGKHASHYYSLPFIDISGSVESANGTIELSGKAWYDHEWTSTLLDSSTAGWDWMSLHFDNGDKLMAFSMRLNDQENYQTGTYILANGQSETLSPEQISLNISKYTQTDDRSLPLHWQVSIPHKQVDIEVTATKTDAFNPSVFGYYEGPVEIIGSHRGVGFLELTGY
ncbi:lipocalin-like domain-containing protein [Glaciecola sp. SC05]|uniref:lipocalin-like domain-containing protein n=1 Tax=Glaciecola sp. SC05 TaxID=1987355 RepID=UPI0035270A5D